MTDLTEQWKKGKLESGWYYINSGDIDYKYSKYNSADFFVTPHEDIEQVLARVPSYKEWIGVKQQRDLENKLRHDSDNKNWQLRTENTQLKELLKECREILDYAKDFAYNDPCCKCIAKIDNALGEK